MGIGNFSSGLMVYGGDELSSYSFFDVSRKKLIFCYPIKLKIKISITNF